MYQHILVLYYAIIKQTFFRVYGTDKSTNESMIQSTIDRSRNFARVGKRLEGSLFSTRDTVEVS